MEKVDFAVSEKQKNKSQKGVKGMKNIPIYHAKVERKKKYAEPILTMVRVDADCLTDSLISNDPNETPGIYLD